jgi:uncharacterized protein YdeI (YjbR/CyaY-like superfamily)
MPPVKVDLDKVREFKDAQSFYKWLGKHHGKENELWIKIHKVDSGLKSITPKEAIDVALCWGWIDAVRKPFDDKSYLQRYTPRGKKSTWSQINVDNVARLIKESRMTEHGIEEVEAAKSDGRWDRAYKSGKDMKIPDDLQAAIDAEPKAKVMLEKLSAESLRAGLPHPQHEDRSREEEEDRDLHRDAQARRDDLPAGEEMSLWVAFLCE